MERDALEARLNEVLAELDGLTRAVSHDLRAPLRAIQGFSQITLEEYASLLPEDGREHLRRISASARRMSWMIDDLLRLSKIERSPLACERLGLSAMARSAWHVLERADPRRAVAISIDEGLEAWGDRRLISQLLEQLLDNGRKFTAKTEAPTVIVGSRLVDGVPAFFVADNGAGFNAAYAHRLFKPFQRLHPDSEFPGHGSGLAAVWRIVRRHGGRVWAEGAVGCGATVFFTLPPSSHGAE